jgi:hypothetical protein
LETVTIKIVLLDKSHAIQECVLEATLRDLQANELVHGLQMSFSFVSPLVECLILLSDPLYLLLDFQRPLVPFHLLSLIAVIFEFAYLVKLCLFLHFQDRLFYGLGEKYIENGLYFAIVVEKIIVLNLSDLVDTCLFRGIGGSWRAWFELVSLNFYFYFLRFLLALLC